jgi:hypothetical protein
MKSVTSLRFALLIAVAAAFAGCDPASGLVHSEYESATAPSDGADHADAATPTHSDGLAPAQTPCPCFGSKSFASFDPAYYLFFDTFNYYGLDARRTEARGLVSTPAGPLEEVASIYITYADQGELALICHRQSVVTDPTTGEPTYEYGTLAPSIEQAESCRRALYASVGAQEPCQGGACGFEYTKEQLDPSYPPYHDGDLKTPKTLLDAMQKRVADVGRLLQRPA